MRAVIQRVAEACVKVDGRVTGSIGKGLLILVGIEDADTQEDIDWLTKKIVGLMASTKKGNRPSYIRASKGDFAQPMYEKFCLALEQESGKKTEKGIFGADMKVSLLNDGPVTIIMDTKNKE